MIKTNWLRREGRKSETETWNGRKDRNISFYVYIYIFRSIWIYMDIGKLFEKYMMLTLN